MAIIYGPPDHVNKPSSEKEKSAFGNDLDNNAEISENRDTFERSLKYCPFCGESILDRFHFCPMCGKDLEPAKDPEATVGFCNHCGKNIPTISSYCPYCGKRARRMMNA